MRQPPRIRSHKIVPKADRGEPWDDYMLRVARFAKRDGSSDDVERSCCPLRSFVRLRVMAIPTRPFGVARLFSPESPRGGVVGKAYKVKVSEKFQYSGEIGCIYYVRAYEDDGYRQINRRSVYSHWWMREALVIDGRRVRHDRRNSNHYRYEISDKHNPVRWRFVRDLKRGRWRKDAQPTPRAYFERREKELRGPPPKTFTELLAMTDEEKRAYFKSKEMKPHCCIR